jgi:hypothetical protein
MKETIITKDIMKLPKQLEHLFHFPIFSWIKTYDVKRNMLSDFRSGVLVFVLLIPQGKYLY